MTSYSGDAFPTNTVQLKSPPLPPFFNLSVKTPCLHLPPEPYQYSWLCRLRLCDGCLISLWSPSRGPCRRFTAPTTERRLKCRENSCLHWSPYTFFAIHMLVHRHTDAAHGHMNTCIYFRSLQGVTSRRQQLWAQPFSNCAVTARLKRGGFSEVIKKHQPLVITVYKSVALQQNNMGILQTMCQRPKPGMVIKNKSVWYKFTSVNFYLF